MIDAIRSSLRAMLVVIAVAVGIPTTGIPTTGIPTAGSLSAGVAVGAILLTAAVVIALLGAFIAPPPARSLCGRPRRSIDASVTPAQSDPDAAGHPRSRAPGYAPSAA